MTLRSGPGAGPFRPSEKFELSEYTIDAVETTAPTDRQNGLDVSKWRRVVLSVHPVEPEIDDAAVADWRATIKIWRWKQKASEGTGRAGGQWYADQEVVVSMDGNVAAVNGGPMEYELPCWDSEKMYFQVVSNVEAPDNWVLKVALYGLVPWITEDGKLCQCESAGSASASSSGATPIIASMFDLIAHEDYTYSTLRGDFSVTRNAANQIIINDLDFAIVASNVLAIGVKVSGTTEMDIWYRDKDLVVSYAGATSILTTTGIVYGATDEIHVWIEGPSKTLSLTQRERRTLNTNPDSLHVVTDGTVVFTTIAEGGAEEDYPFMMAQDGYHWLTAYFLITSDAYVRLEAADNLARDGGETWADITEEAFGVSQIDANNLPASNNMPLQSCINHRRCRWVIGEDGSGGTAVINMTRSAYGGLWNPVARESIAVLEGGYPIMGETRATQAAALAAVTAGRFVTNLYKELVLANYIWATQANRTEEDDPLDTRDIPTTLELTDLSAAQHDYYFDMNHLKYISFQIDLSAALGVGITVWVSNQDDGTAPAACFFTDITNAWFGAASFNADSYLERYVPVNAKWIRLRLDNTGGAGTEDANVYVRQAANG